MIETAHPEPALSLRVLATRAVAVGVREFVLDRPGGGPLPRWEPGAHIDLLLGGGLVRQYSLCGDPGDATTWRIAVLREPGSRGGSVHLHDAVRPGDVLGARGPRNHFRLRPAPAYLFVAGGIGITPLLPMIGAVAAERAEWRLLYGGRQRMSLAYADELAAHGPRVQVRPQDETGLLDIDAALASAPPDALVYCCGPEPLLRAVEQRCAPERLQVERFAPRDTRGGTGPFDVVLRRSGRRIHVDAETSLLSALERAGVAVLPSCREGTCGSCETAVLAGRPDHRDSVLDETDRTEGTTMMICVSRSLTPELELDL
ncbi:PDR/VanB family oxidoreductase [Pseudonocardia sp. GCM10023141]|uniref:PDR/VanB family oxidoreductase n=1 Tax=Pseudonocardia sp. GCM10023141 TaxID=3252653 RepID=UPI003620F9AD